MRCSSGRALTSGYDSPEALEAFRYLDGMIRDGIAPDVRYTTENPPKDLFNNGRSALYLSGNWEAALLQESPAREHLGVAPMIHGAQEANVIHGIGCAMSSRSRHKPAASAFLAFLGSEEANRIQAAAGAANPAFIGTNDAYIEAIPEFSLDVFVDAAETALPTRPRRTPLRGCSSRSCCSRRSSAGTRRSRTGPGSSPTA